MDEILRAIHLVGVTVFLGNIITTLVWKIHAEKSRNPQIIRHALSVAITTDKTITVPSVIVITLSGFILVFVENLRILDYLWLELSLALWLTNAAVAIGYLVPSLKKLTLIAELAVKENKLGSDYFTLSKRWNAVSFLLIIGPLAILVLMIVKRPR